jgi:ABC-2 type transport system ATP-binding protein
VLLFDEPVNGLDPEGILWIRTFMQRLAAEGRTVFVSSHLLSEMALTASELVVIGRGRLIAQGPVQQFVDGSSANEVVVRSPQAEALAQVLRDHGATAVPEDGRLRVTGTTTDAVGELAAQHGFVLHELTQKRASLEEAFIEMTGQDVEYVAGGSGRGPHSGEGRR